jgi:membrane protein
LLGAQVTYAHQHIHYFLGDRDLLAQSAAGREKLALLMMLLIGRNFRRGLAPPSITEVAAQLRVPAGIVKEFMVMFAALKLVLPLSDEETYVLSRDPATISIKEILDGVKNSGVGVKAPRATGKEENAIDDILSEVDQATAQTLEGKNLQTLILSMEPPSARR